MLNKIVIAGYGAVGKAVEAALKQHKDVSYMIDDPYVFGPEIRGNDTISFEPDGVVVGVATPQAEDGRCYTDNVRDVFEKYGPGPKYLVKSAVDPLFLKEWGETYDITVSPEFLRGTTGADPTKDFIEQEFAVYGGGSMRYWDELFKPVLPKLKKVSYCSLEQAAFAKYLENSFLATRVTFFNEMYKIYEACGFKDFDVMIEAIGHDPRIGHSHSQVPGPDGKFGWGGHCLPKDTSALTTLAAAQGYDAKFMKALREINDEHRNGSD